MAEDAKKKWQVDPSVRSGTIPVCAKHCLWFAWVEGEIDGPHGEKGEDFRPQAIPLEEDDVEVVCEILDPDKEWRHGDGADEVSTWKGRSKIQKSFSEYQAAKFRSQHLNTLETNLNRLVFMFDFGDAPTEPNVVVQEAVPIDATTFTLPVPEGDGAQKRLFFGFHDAFEWTNNKGAIQVSFTKEKIVKS